MKDVLKKAVQSGLWIQPIAFLGIMDIAYNITPDNPRSLKVWIIIFVLSFIPLLLIVMDKLNRPSVQNASHGKEKAMRPEVPKELICDKPTGLTLGKWKNKYVCADIWKYQFHEFIIGGSGSGKTSTILIPTLLANKDVPALVIDIKGEISLKTKKLTDDKLIIFNPQERNGTYGYNPLFQLSDTAINQEVFEVMQSIVHSLISLGGNSENDFWKLSARNYMLGAFLYVYINKDIHEFIRFERFLVFQKN